MVEVVDALPSRQRADASHVSQQLGQPRPRANSQDGQPESKRAKSESDGRKMLQTVHEKVGEQQSRARAHAHAEHEHLTFPMSKFRGAPRPSADAESMQSDVCASEDATAPESLTVAGMGCIASAGAGDAKHHAKVATQLHTDPAGMSDALMRLLKQFPLEADFEGELEDMLDELHCPLPLLHPSVASCHPKRKILPREHSYHYCFQPYSAHAWWTAQEEERHQIGSSSKQRRLLMGKSLNPTTPPLVQSASRQKLVGGVLASTHHQRAASSERADVSDRRCPLCMQARQKSEYGPGTKARYCRDCEKLRRLGRKRGLNVNALRAARDRYAHKNLSAHELVERAASDFPPMPSCGTSGEGTAAVASGDDAGYDVSRDISLEGDTLENSGLPVGSATNGSGIAEDPELELITALLEGGAAVARSPSVCSSSATQSAWSFAGHAFIDCVL
jgi:hypothetical protein